MNKVKKIFTPLSYNDLSFFNDDFNNQNKIIESTLLILTEDILNLFYKDINIFTWFINHIKKYSSFYIEFYNVSNEYYLLDMMSKFNEFSNQKVINENTLNSVLQNYQCKKFLVYMTEQVSIEIDLFKIHIKPNISLEEFIEIITQINLIDGQVNEHSRPS